MGSKTVKFSREVVAKAKHFGEDEWCCWLDEGLRGWGIRCYPTTPEGEGPRKYFVRTTIKGTRQRLYWEFRTVSESGDDWLDARKSAVGYLHSARRLGVDPRPHRQVQELPVRTLSDLAAAYIGRKNSSGGERPWSSRKCEESLVRCYLSRGFVDAEGNAHGPIGEIPLESIRRADVRALVESIADKPNTRNRLLGIIRAMWRWGVDREWPECLDSPNPTESLRVRVPPRGEIVTIKDHEFPKLFQALSSIGVLFPVPVLLFRLLLWTGARRDELRCARWNEVAWGERTITRPHGKMGGPITLVFTDESWKDVERLHKLTGKGELMFPGPSGKPISIDAALDRIRGASGLAHFSPASCRRTLASLLHRVCESDLTVDKVLNHISHSILGRHYARTGLPAVRKALTDAHRLIQDLVGAGENTH